MGQNIGQLTKEDIQMVNKLIEKSTTFLVIREMKIKATVEYYTLTRMTKIEISDGIKYW